MNIYAGTYRSPINGKLILAYVEAGDANEAREKLLHCGPSATIKSCGASLEHVLSCGYVQIDTSGVYISTR